MSYKNQILKQIAHGRTSKKSYLDLIRNRNVVPHKLFVNKEYPGSDDLDELVLLEKLLGEKWDSNGSSTNRTSTSDQSDSNHLEIDFASETGTEDVTTLNPLQCEIYIKKNESNVVPDLIEKMDENTNDLMKDFVEKPLGSEGSIEILADQNSKQRERITKIVKSNRSNKSNKSRNSHKKTIKNAMSNSKKKRPNRNIHRKKKGSRSKTTKKHPTDLSVLEIEAQTTVEPENKLENDLMTELEIVPKINADLEIQAEATEAITSNPVVQIDDTLEFEQISQAEETINDIIGIIEKDLRDMTETVETTETIETTDKSNVIYSESDSVEKLSETKSDSKSDLERDKLESKIEELEEYVIEMAVEIENLLKNQEKFIKVINRLSMELMITKNKIAR